MKEKIVYGLYDGRYLTRPDRAIMYEFCDTLKDARNNAPDYGDDTFIVKCSVKVNSLTRLEIVK